WVFWGVAGGVMPRKSARGLAHSKNLPERKALPDSRQRLGVRQPSAALGEGVFWRNARQASQPSGKQLANARDWAFDCRMSQERSENPVDEMEGPLGRSRRERQLLTKSKFYLLGGFLMGLISVLGLVWQQSFVWQVCPQALVVMFLRQSQHAYDSVGAADYPELMVAILYYPLLGWILARAAARDKLQ